MRAALSVLGASGADSRGRRIAVLGDMLELGPDSAALHAGLANSIAANKIDLVFTVGPNMKHLSVSLPSNQVAGHADCSTDIVASVLETVSTDDVVMIKGSLGSRMAVVVDALLTLNPSRQTAPAKTVNGR